MANEGEISVQLKLELSNLQSQIAAATNQLKAGFKGASFEVVAPKAASDVEKLGVAQDKLTEKIKKSTSAVKEFKQRMADIASGKISPVEPGMQIRGLEQQPQKGRKAPSWMGAEQAQKFTDTEEVRERANLAAQLRAQRAVRRAGAPALADDPSKPKPVADKPKYPSWMGAEQAQKFTDAEEVRERKAVADSLRAERAKRQQPQPVVQPQPQYPVNRVMAQRQVNLPAPQLPVVPQLAPPPVAQAPVPAAAQKPSLLPMLAAGLGTAIGGPMGGAVAGLLTKANPAVAAVTAAMTALRFSVMKASQAMDDARRLYAKSLTSGLSMQFNAKRGAMAEALGVSEAEILQYGKQIDYLTEKFQVSSKVLAENARVLAATAWEATAFKKNMQALWAQLSGAMAPAIQEMIRGMNGLIETFMKSDAIVGLGREIGVVINIISKAFQVLGLALSGLGLIVQAAADTLTAAMVGWNNLLAKIPGAGKFGVTHIDADAYAGTKKMSEGVMKQWKNLFSGSDVKNAPGPQAHMKQMPASTWERMGLVVGAGGGTNYQKMTADHTKEANKHLQSIAKALMGNNKFSPKSQPAIPAAA